MARDYAPNHAIWALVSGSLEDLDEHLQDYETESGQVGHFEQMIKVVRDGERPRVFILKLTERR